MRKSTRRFPLMLLVILTVALILSACGIAEEGTPAATLEPTSAPSPTDTVRPDSGSALAPASELRSNCLNWPEQEISPTNYARHMTGVAEGQPAVDFALRDVRGTTYTLSELLETKPVLLVLGGFT